MKPLIANKRERFILEFIQAPCVVAAWFLSHMNGLKFGSGTNNQNHCIDPFRQRSCSKLSHLIYDYMSSLLEAPGPLVQSTIQLIWD